jgi:methyl-accepting chemotaxis protein
MNLFRSLKVGTKLIGGFLLVALIVVLVAGVGFVNMNSINTGMTTLYEDRTLPIEQLGQVDAMLFKMRGDVYKYILLADERTASAEALAEDVALIDAELELYRATQMVAEETAALKVLDTAWAQYQLTVDDVIAGVNSGDTVGALESLRDGGQASNARKAVGQAIDELIAINVRVAEETHTQGEATFANASLMLIVATIFSVLLALGLGIVITRSITVPLSDVARAAVAIASGDLDQKVAVRSQDEVGQMAQAFGRMIAYLHGMAGVAGKMAEGDLRETVTPQSERDVLGQAFQRMIVSLRGLATQVTDNADALGAASTQLASAAEQAGQATSQIATTVQQVARGTTQQTAGVTQTASGMEQMKRAIDGVARGAQDQASAVGKVAAISERLSSAITQVAGNAQTVTRDAASAAQAAQTGARTVSDTIHGMDAIKAKVGVSAQKVRDMGQRSDQIGAIVETIDDIASQTNLLALNAAIEAARAGEHGKGFAVVADEVRKLAERASSATKEIGGLISGMQRTVAEAVRAMDEGAVEVENGAAAANQAGSALNDILQAARAVQEQASAALEASDRMGSLSAQLVEATEAVSAVVEENTAATEEMAAGSAEIVQAIEGIASVSEENSAAVEEVSASAEEMTAQVEEVSASAQSLAGMAEQLQRVVGQFQLPAEGTVASTTTLAVRATRARLAVH